MIVIDLETPGVARMHDFMLGGARNHAVDRAAANAFSQAVPGIEIAVGQHRGFVLRAVRNLAELGVRQFLDLGSGLPSLSSVHEVAREIDPSAAVVYVDNEPQIVAHTELMTAHDTNTGVVHADLSDVDHVLRNDVTRGVLEIAQPIAVLMCGSLHHLPDDPEPVVAAYVDALSPGSVLVLSHLTTGSAPDAATAAQMQYATTSSPVWPRTEAWFRKQFIGLELLAPGITTPAAWRPPIPDIPEHPPLFVAGVGRKVAC